MKSDVEILSDKIIERGGNPVSILKQALSEQALDCFSPVIISCQSCISQKKCELRDLATKIIQFKAPFEQVLDLEPIFGKEFYSHIAISCAGFSPIEDKIFGVSKE